MFVKIFRRQYNTQTRTSKINKGKEKFHPADQDQLPSKTTKSYLLTMIPIDKGGHIFNSNNEEEWEIQKNTDTVFSVYGRVIINQKYFFCLIIYSGENLDGAELSFTTHRNSCQWERKDTVYRLRVNASDPHDRMSERASITFNLPYYNQTLYLCLSPKGSNEVFHQGNR